MRALLRGFGLAVGAVTRSRFEDRVWELVGQEPLLKDAVEPLLMARRCLEDKIKDLERRIGSVTSAPPVCSRLMTVPGVGPLTALSFVSASDAPERFKR